MKPWRKKMQYLMDNWFSRGLVGPVLSLGALSLIIILIAAAVMTALGLAPAGEPGYTFLEAFWTSLVRALGGGSIGLRGTPWGFRFVMFGITMAGVFIVSLLIGTLTNTIRTRIDELRKGRSEVVENGHIAILGWSNQIFSIVGELVAAGASQKETPCIVILAQQDKTSMEDQLHRKLGRKARVRLVCRTGSPMELDDLKILSLNTTKSIIVLSPESENPDADAVKTVLAITHMPNRRSQPFQIVACVRDPRNMAVARVAGRHEVTWINTGHMVARIIAQTCRQCGLSLVYSELLNFGGNEIYFHEDPMLVGKRFGEVLPMFGNDTVIGVLTADQKPHLNPGMETMLRPGDHLILISRDNDQIAVTANNPVSIQEAALSREPMPPKRPERTLVLGWNWRAPVVLEQLDHYVAPGSEVVIAADQKGIKAALEGLDGKLRNQKVRYLRGDITDRALLENVGLDRFSHVIILSYSDGLDPQRADAQTLISLLHLRDLADERQYRYTMTSEMMDDRNRKLAMVTRADDFIVSDRLVSLMMAQVAENRTVSGVFDDLFDPDGSEVYLKPARAYVCPGMPVNFYTVVEAARRKGEVAIGYRLTGFARDAQRFYGVVVNPAKGEPVTFSEQDRIIVLAKS